jgi:multidrug efflux pump subunit AcrB
VRLRDVAGVELGSGNYSASAKLDQFPALALLIKQQPGSNALETADRIRATVEDMSEKFPAGLAYRVIYNPTGIVAESIAEVE